MNKLPIMSSLPSPLARVFDRQPKNPSQAKQVGLKRLFRLSAGFCLAAFLSVGQAEADGPALTVKVKPAPTARANPILPRRETARKGNWLDVTVKNPHCPACLKTLQTYLMAVKGVKEVKVTDLAGIGQKVQVSVRVALPSLGSRVVERIKAHDLEILGTRQTF